MYYYKLCILTFSILICSSNSILSQGNCLLYVEDSGNRKACELSYKALEQKQGSKESQLLFDQAITVGPDYAYAYYQKSVPFFKRGLFAEGLLLINKAITLEPQNYLFYRAYYYFYNRSYDLCINDLEELYNQHQASYVTNPGGELEMRILLALSHAYEGQLEKGIDWMLNLMERYKKQPNLIGLFDHYCLGMLYFKNAQYDLAQLHFNKQLTVDSDFADTYYYLGMLSEMNSKRAKANEYFKKAWDKMNRKNGGYSTSFFTEFNTDKASVKMKLLK